MTTRKIRELAIVIASAIVLIVIVAVAMLMPGRSEGPIVDQEFNGNQEIILTTSQAVDASLAKAKNFTVYEENDPDIQVHPSEVQIKGNKIILKFAEPLDTANTHIVKAPEIAQGAGPLSIHVSRSYWGYLISIMISALLINNYVFTKYLGLCVFFGTSKRKKTATGMGIVFTIVMLISAIMSWFFYQYVLVPFHLDFLQVVVFIGLVSLTVQAVDTMLRKLNPHLFKSFGVFLVLVIANCIIIAVPLYMAGNQYGLLETIMLALGAGGGFLLALYLMGSVRERLELAQIPECFRGLPIAFITAGQFALAFLGFSGLQVS